MKRLELTLAMVVTLISASLFFPSSAAAGEMSTSGVTVTWSDSLYEVPLTELRSTGDYKFKYSIPNGILFGAVTVTNKYGEVLNAAGLSAKFFGNKGANSGTVTVKIGNSVNKPLDWSGTEVCLSVTLKAGAGETSTCKPITFLKRDVATSSKPKTSTSKTPVSKPTSITCIKGTSTVKVTEVNPVCPSGYKKK